MDTMHWLDHNPPDKAVVLHEADSKSLLGALGIPVVQKRLEPPAVTPPPVPPEAIGRLFHPRNIAFIGVSARLG